VEVVGGVDRRYDIIAVVEEIIAVVQVIVVIY